jgi:outer membrane protein assembly factor BamB
VHRFCKSGRLCFTLVHAIRSDDGTYLWQYQGETLEVEGADATAYILSFKENSTGQLTATLTALHMSGGKSLWQHSAPAAGLVLANDVLYTGYGGNGKTTACYATGKAQIVKYQATSGQELWHLQL